MRTKGLDDIVADIVEASDGIAVIEAPKHLPTVRIRQTLTTVRKLRLMLQALEARLERASQVSEAG